MGFEKHRMYVCFLCFRSVVCALVLRQAVPVVRVQSSRHACAAGTVRLRVVLVLLGDAAQ